MSERAVPVYEGNPRGDGGRGGARIAVVVSRFNEVVTDELLSGCLGCLKASGVAPEAIDIFKVPGAWEIPGAAACALDTGRYGALVALGCVIRGETPHFDYVAGEAAAGLMRLSLQSRVPVTFGVLTTDTMEQALARAGGRGGNKGFDAAEAALELMDLFARIDHGEPRA